MTSIFLEVHWWWIAAAWIGALLVGFIAGLFEPESKDDNEEGR